MRGRNSWDQARERQSAYITGGGRKAPDKPRVRGKGVANGRNFRFATGDFKRGEPAGEPFAQRFYISFFACPAAKKRIVPGFGAKPMEGLALARSEEPACDALTIFKRPNLLDIESDRRAMADCASPKIAGMRDVEVHRRVIRQARLALGRVVETELRRRSTTGAPQQQPEHAAARAEALLQVGKAEAPGALPFIGREKFRQLCFGVGRLREIDYRNLGIVKQHLVLPVILPVVLAMCLALAAAQPPETALLPQSHLIDSKVADTHLFGPSLAPGGILGNYRDAKGPYQLLLVRLPTNDKAAFLLLDIKKLMTEQHYLAHMGGFAGKKDGQFLYVFAKGPFIAAVKGKPEAEADVLARIFAARLPLR